MDLLYIKEVVWTGTKAKRKYARLEEPPNGTASPRMDDTNHTNHSFPQSDKVNTTHGSTSTTTLPSLGNIQSATINSLEKGHHRPVPLHPTNTNLPAYPTRQANGYLPANTVLDPANKLPPIITLPPNKLPPRIALPPTRSSFPELFPPANRYPSSNAFHNATLSHPTSELHPNKDMPPTRMSFPQLQAPSPSLTLSQAKHGSKFHDQGT